MKCVGEEERAVTGDACPFRPWRCSWEGFCEGSGARGRGSGRGGQEERAHGVPGWVLREHVCKFICKGCSDGGVHIGAVLASVLS